MTTAQVVQFEFRCTRCYHTLYASVKESGTTLDCRWCGSSLVVPDATEERIQRAANAPHFQSVGAETAEGVLADEKPNSRKDLAKLAKERAEQRSRGAAKRCRNPQHMSASRIRRLVAACVDEFLLIVASALSGILTAIFVAQGVLEFEISQFKPKPGDYSFLTKMPWEVLASFLFVPAVFTLGQWTMIALRGQSVGKWMLRIKIVDTDGYAPGLLRGVILRLWPRLLLNCSPVLWPNDYVVLFAPMLAIANLLVIFAEPPRCLHDHLAGTYVIYA